MTEERETNGREIRRGEKEQPERWEKQERAVFPNKTEGEQDTDRKEVFVFESWQVTGDLTRSDLGRGGNGGQG